MALDDDFGSIDADVNFGSDASSGGGSESGVSLKEIGEVGGAVVDGLKAAGNFVSGLFGKKKSSSETGLSLPPALQQALLESSQQNLELLRNSVSQIDTLIKNYDSRIDMINKGIEGTIPESSLLKELTQNSADIALSLGADAQQLIDNGFLDADDVSRIEELDQFNDQEFVDQQFEQEFKGQRDALEQQLLRDGRSLAEVSQTLSVFDSQKSVERQQRGEVLKQGAFNRGIQTIQARSGLKQQNFNQTLQGFQAGQQVIGNAQNQFGNLANLAQSQGNFAIGGFNAQANFAGVQQNLFESLGQFQLDGEETKENAVQRAGEAIGITKRDVQLGVLNTGAGATIAAGKAALAGIKKLF